MDGIIVKEATTQDADALGELEYRTFDITGREYWKDRPWWRNGETVKTCQDDWRDFFKDYPNPRAFAAWDKDRCLGGVWFWTLDNNKQDRTRYPANLPPNFTGTIAQMAIMVDPDHLRQGIGRQLMIRTVEDMKSLGYSFGFLITNKNNIRACKFYEAMGWKFDGLVVPPNGVEARYAVKLK